MSQRVLILAALLLAGTAAGEEKFEPPLEKRPANFSGGVGTFKVAAEATPAKVAIGKPVLFTLRVTAIGKPVAAPARPRLESDADFKKLFAVETPEPALKHPDDVTWEFYYRLRPRSTDAREIPEVEFSYFDPAFGQDPSGYQKKFTDAVPLKVTPAPTEVPKVEGSGGPAAVPDAVLGIVRGEEILAHRRPWSPPGVAILVALLLAPPLACVAWYAVWRRLYPDAARLAHRRRSRAARQALHAISAARALPPHEQGERLADAVTGFLRQRLDLPGAVPTPGETAAHLARVGAAETVQRQALRFFVACDAARFSPAPSGSGELADAASALVLAVEAETWSSHPS
jgi:hypothetical protein